MKWEPEKVNVLSASVYMVCVRDCVCMCEGGGGANVLKNDLVSLFDVKLEIYHLFCSQFEHFEQ